MHSRHLSWALALIYAVGWLAVEPVQAQRPADQIRQLLQERDNEIKSILGDQKELTDTERQRLKRVINDNIDFRALARQALGPFWTEINSDQQSQFVDIFSNVVRSQSLSNLEVYRAEIQYNDITVSGDSAYVETTAIHSNTSTSVHYVMKRTNDRWWVTDIILDEVSTAESYARSFQTVIRQRGFDTLMNSLQKKLKKLQETSTD